MKGIVRRMANRSRLSLETTHTRFSVVFSTLLFGICNALNIERLAKWFRRGDGLDLSALCAYLLAGLCLSILVFTLLAHRLTIKPYAILLTILSAAVTYFIGKYGVAIDSSMILNAVHTDPTEVGQLMSLQMLPYVMFLMVLPVVLICFTKITFQPAGRYLLASLKLIAITLCVALASLAIEYQPILLAGNVSNKYIVYSLVPINLISGSVNAATKSLKPYLKKDEKDVEIHASVSTPGNLVVVLAVGEASRRKNFSVYGYQRRNTNPVLQKTSDLHLLDGVASRASTLYALPRILEKDDIKLTTMVSRVGIPTACYVNYTLYDNCASPGETKTRQLRPRWKVLRRRRGADAEKQSHQLRLRIPVHRAAPGARQPRSPCTVTGTHPSSCSSSQPVNDADVANKCSIEQIYNSYDNTILYVDHVLGQVIQTLDSSKVPYVLIYLSDHGESLMENGVLFHGMPPGMTLPAEQAQIPLIVKSSLPISIVPRAEYPQSDVFDTVLDLFSIQSTQFDKAGSFIRKPAN